MTEAVLRTPRLALRPVCLTDAPALHAVLSNAQAMRYWSSLLHHSLQQTLDWVRSMRDIAPSEGEDFVIEHQGRVIGKAGLYRFPEIGFVLHPDFWGQGLAREALRAVLARAFEIHRLPAVVADVDPRNDASLRLLMGLGFIETGRAARTWKIGQQWCDSVYLRLTQQAHRAADC